MTSPTDNVKRAKELGMPALAISDHGTVAGLFEHYNACKKAGLVPLLGNELYFKERLHDGDKDRKYFHGVFLAMNSTGYKNLLKLSSIGFRDDHYEFGRPIVTIDEVLSNSEGLVYSTGCMIGIVGVSARRPYTFDESDANFARFAEVFRGRMFVEIGPAQICADWKKVDEETKRYDFVQRDHRHVESEHSTIWTNCLQVEHNTRAIALAKKHGLPTIIASDAHMATPDLKHVQDMLISGSSFGRFHFHQTHAMLSTDDTWAMVQANHSYIEQSAFEGMVDNTYQVVDLCRGLELKFPTLVPKFQLARHPLWHEGMSSRDLMFAIIKSVGRMREDPVYHARLKEEVRVICDNGICDYTDYFLILADIFRAAKQLGVGAGPARGSAGGCLLAYLLNITAIDPIKWNLNFTRFLNEGRLKKGTVPDIDCDFSDRGPVVDYVFNTYGDDHTASVGSYQGIKSKNALKDIARWKAGGFLADDDEIHKITASIKPAPALYGGIERNWLLGFTDANDVVHPGHLDANPLLKRYLKESPDVDELFWKILEKPRSMGQHAGGVVITPMPIDEVIPTRYHEGRKCTQIPHTTLEKMGGMKIDLLGVNTLNWIWNTVDLVRKRTGQELDPWNLPEELPPFEAMWGGRADTVFQFDTGLISPFLRRLKPKRIHDLILITSVCRPGGLDSYINGVTVAEHFVKRYNGQEKVVYQDELLRSILEDTYGLVIFQEQIQRIFEVVGGFNSVEADSARKAVGKKDLIVFNSLKTRLAEGALRLHGWDAAKVEVLWDSFIGAANYSFNRAHACAYAIMAYACCYLKHHYPLEWWCSVLSNAKKEDIPQYLTVTRDWIQLPHVNATASRWVVRGDKLLAPITAVRSMGPKAYDDLAAEFARGGPFTSFDEFYARVQGRAVHKGVITNLAIAGCFDGLPLSPGGPPAYEYAFVDRLRELRKEKVTPKKPARVPLSKPAALALKMATLPIFTCDLVETFDDELQKEPGYQRTPRLTMLGTTPVISDFSKFWPVSNSPTFHRAFNSEIAIVGMVVDKKPFSYKSKNAKDNGKTMHAQRLTVVNDGRLIEFVLWPNTIKFLGTVPGPGSVILAYGGLEYSDFKQDIGLSLSRVSKLGV